MRALLVRLGAVLLKFLEDTRFYLLPLHITLHSLPFLFLCRAKQLFWKSFLDMVSIHVTWFLDRLPDNEAIACPVMLRCLGQGAGGGTFVPWQTVLFRYLPLSYDPSLRCWLTGALHYFSVLAQFLAIADVPVMCLVKTDHAITDMFGTCLVMTCHTITDIFVTCVWWRHVTQSAVLPSQWHRLCSQPRPARCIPAFETYNYVRSDILIRYYISMIC